MAQLLDLFVDGGVLLDERVGLRHVGFRLIVVVIADEIDDRVMGEKLLELGGELGGERLVRRHDERGLLHGLDGLRHRERLARPCHAEKRLIAQTALDAFGERRDGLRLITRRFVGGHDLERFAR